MFDHTKFRPNDFSFIDILSSEQLAVLHAVQCIQDRNDTMKARGEAASTLLVACKLGVTPLRAAEILSQLERYGLVFERLKGSKDGKDQKEWRVTQLARNRLRGKIRRCSGQSKSSNLTGSHLGRAS